MTVGNVREQLKMIRLYYANRACFDMAFRVLPHVVMEVAEKYAEIIRSSPLELYLLYYELYVKGLTQESAAEELGYSTEYVRQKHRRLVEYLTERIQGGGNEGSDGTR